MIPAVDVAQAQEGPALEAMARTPGILEWFRVLQPPAWLLPNMLKKGCHGRVPEKGPVRVWVAFGRGVSQAGLCKACCEE